MPVMCFYQTKEKFLQSCLLTVFEIWCNSPSDSVPRSRLSSFVLTRNWLTTVWRLNINSPLPDGAYAKHTARCPQCQGRAVCACADVVGKVAGTARFHIGVCVSVVAVMQWTVWRSLAAAVLLISRWVCWVRICMKDVSQWNAVFFSFAALFENNMKGDLLFVGYIYYLLLYLLGSDHTLCTDQF